MSVARSRRIRAAPRIPAGLALVVPIVTLLTLLIYPLGLMAEQSIATPRGLSLAVTRNLLGSVMFRRALWHTIQIAGTATAICLVLGTTLALLLHITEMPGARAIGRLIDTYLAFPSFLIALALTFLYGNAGMITVLLQQVFGAAPNAASFLMGSGASCSPR
jgi:ABC-type sulfate transport system, permease component